MKFKGQSLKNTAMSKIACLINIDVQQNILNKLYYFNDQIFAFNRKIILKWKFVDNNFSKFTDSNMIELDLENDFIVGLVH